MSMLIFVAALHNEMVMKKHNICIDPSNMQCALCNKMANSSSLKLSVSGTIHYAKIAITDLQRANVEDMKN
jgi:hypothetical protein